MRKAGDLRPPVAASPRSLRIHSNAGTGGDGKQQNVTTASAGHGTGSLEGGIEQALHRRAHFTDQQGQQEQAQQQ